MVDLQSLLKDLKLNKKEFAQLLGVTPPSITNVIQGRMKFPEAWKEVLLTKFNLNADDYILVESGAAFGNIKHYNNNPKSSNENNQNNNEVPYYDVVATGSNRNVTVLTTPSTVPSGYLNVGDLLPRAECVIRVAGNSMMPNYPAGALIGLRRILDGLFDYGSVYVIETEDNRFIKRIFKGKDDASIQLYSDNDQTYDSGARKGLLMYEPFNLPKSYIKRVFKVVGTVKSNDHSHIP